MGIRPFNALSCGFTAIGEELYLSCCGSTPPSQEPAVEKSFEQSVEDFLEGVCSFTTLVCDMTYDFVCDLLKWLYNILACLLCLTPITNNVDLAAIAATRGYSINRAKLHEVPEPIASDPTSLPDVALSDLHEIYRQREQVSEDNEHYLDLKNLADFVRSSKEASEMAKPLLGEELAKPEDEQDLVRIRSLRTEIYLGDNIYLYALNLIYEIKNHPTYDFVALADKSNSCGPVKYKIIKSEFERITGRARDVEQQLLLVAKRTKHSLILDAFQTTQFHVINHASKQVSDWGLDADEVERADAHIHVGSSDLGALNYRYILNRNFTPARLATNFKTDLETRGNEQMNAFLEEHVSHLPEGWDDGNSKNCFYEVDPITGALNRLNYKGVAWVIAKLGYFC